MPRHDIIVIGASAGGIEALKVLVPQLPAELAATVFVVVHIPPHADSLLPDILARLGPLPVVSPRDRTSIKSGCIYVAPPDYHLLVEPKRVRIVRGPKENRHRPAVDPLFRSAAYTYGPRVIGVVLSGTLDDGTAGMWAVKTCGGIAIVQDPADALYPEMPKNALLNVKVDYTVPIAEMGALLAKLTKQTAKGENQHPAPEKLKLETEFTVMKRDIDDMSKLGQPSAFTCPTCRGALWELHDGELVRYRCHIGHAFSTESLLAEQTDAVEVALDTALRAVAEKAQVLRRMAERFAQRQPRLEAKYRASAAEMDRTQDTLRELLARKVRKTA